jgi:hypothetical protein
LPVTILRSRGKSSGRCQRPSSSAPFV